jgi:hypothetical protein
VRAPWHPDRTYFRPATEPRCAKTAGFPFAEMELTRPPTEAVYCAVELTLACRNIAATSEAASFVIDCSYPLRDRWLGSARRS